MSPIDVPSAPKEEKFTLDENRLTESDEVDLRELREGYQSAKEMVQGQPNCTLTPEEHMLMGSSTVCTGGYATVPTVCVAFPDDPEVVRLVNKARAERKPIRIPNLYAERVNAFNGLENVSEEIKAIHVKIGAFDPTSGSTEVPRIVKIELADGTEVPDATVQQCSFSPEKFAAYMGKSYAHKAASTDPAAQKQAASEKPLFKQHYRTQSN